MLDRLQLRSRITPPEQPPRRRGATSMEPDSDALAVFRRLLGSLPWLQLALGLLVLVAAAAVPWGTSQLLAALDRQIVRVDISGDLVGESRNALEREAGQWLGQSFFATDLARIKATMEQRPWVESAAVRRVWPDRLEVEIREQRPLAYWNDDQLISRSGVIFRPSNRDQAGRLPQLSGPPERARDVIDMARTMVAALEDRGAGFAGLRLEERGAWTLTLASGIEVALGRDQVEQRFERFLVVYGEQLANRVDQVKSIDARYTNGVAVQWKALDSASGNKS